MTGQRYTTVENLGAAIAVAWGISVGNPTVETFVRNPVLYKPMAEIAPEIYWACLFASFGAAAIYCSWADKRQTGTLLMTIVYSLFAVLFFIGDVTSFAWIFYGLFALFNAVHYQKFKWISKQASNR